MHVLVMLCLLFSGEDLHNRCSGTKRCKEGASEEGWTSDLVLLARKGRLTESIVSHCDWSAASDVLVR